MVFFVDVCEGDLERIRENINDLIMWRDVAKSSLWFGFGCLCFLSSCFAKGFSFRYVHRVHSLDFFIFLASVICHIHDETFLCTCLKCFLSGFSCWTSVSWCIVFVTLSSPKVRSFFIRGYAYCT